MYPATPLLRNLVPTDAGYYPRATEQHMRERSRLPGGRSSFTAPRGMAGARWRGRRHAVGKNQMLVINAGVPHAYGAESDSPWSIHWFHAIGANVPHYLERLGITNGQPLVAFGGDVQLYALFEDLLEGIAAWFHLDTHDLCSALAGASHGAYSAS